MKPLHRFFLLPAFLILTSADAPIPVDISPQVSTPARSVAPVPQHPPASELPASGQLTPAIQLHASQQGESVHLAWQRPFTRKGTYYVVMKSQDGATWSSIGGLVEQTTANQARKFGFEDVNQWEAPSFYRLKQVRLDGSTTFSNTVLVKASTATPLELAPNPVDKQFQVSVPPSPQHPVSLRILNLAGQTVASHQLPPAPHLQRKEIDATSLAPGLYWVRVDAPSFHYAHPLVKR